jgi:signal transduction histidine kinase
VEVAAYCIALEAMTNVVHHAQASRCTVCLALNDVLQLEITDDGLGLAEDSVPGVGLASMRERAAELGGTFELQSTPDAGTRIIVSLPVGDNAP